MSTEKKGLGNFAADAATHAQRKSSQQPGQGENWKEIQLDTFTNWVNAQLTKGGYEPVENVVESFQSGVSLVQMLEVLTDKKLGKYQKNPRMKFNRIENINVAFKFIQAEGLKLVNIDATDIESGNANLVLGLLWTIMYHYQILPALASSSGKSAKDALLEWVNSKIPSYNIKNFTSDWNNGRAICALANAVAGNPPIVAGVASMDPSRGQDNCDKGITESYEWLGIPMVVSPENMANPALDELSMMTYISYFKTAKRRSTRMSDEGKGSSAVVAEPEPEPEPEPVKVEKVEEPVASSATGDQSALKPWERSDDWRDYQGPNLGGRNKIRVYFSTTTSSALIRKRSEELMRLMERLKLQDRPDFEPWIPIDIDMTKETRDKIFEKAGTKETPMLFVDDEYVGSYDKIMELNESNELAKIFEY